MRRLTLLICLIAGALLRMSADFHAPEFNFTHYNTANGLPSNCVRDIVQDADGFIWFATDGGLVRFDGSRTRVFMPEDDKGYSGEIFVMSLCCYKNGLLVGTDHGLYCYDPAIERLTPFIPAYGSSVKDKIEGVVHNIAVDSNGAIWVSVEAKGVFRIDPAGEVTANFRFPEMQDFIGMLYVDDNDTVWGVSNTAHGGLYRYDHNRATFIAFPLTIGGQPLPTGGLAITSDSHGDFWLGTWDQGLVKFNGRTGEAQIMTRKEDVWNLWHIHSVTEYSPTMMLVGSDSGLTLVDMTSGEGHVYKSDELDMNSLSGRFVYPVVRDEEGGIWVGTYYRGVNYMSPGSLRFRRWYHSRFANSVSGDVVARLCEDSRGNIWIGSADGGLCMYNPETGMFKHFPLTGSPENENVNALCIDGEKIWVGTYTKGVGVADIATGRWRPVPVEGENKSSCYAICKDSKGRVWMGATETLALYNKERDTFEQVKHLKAWINDIDEDKDGNLWISTQGSGLFRYSPDNGKWANFVGSKSPGTLPGNHINSVKIDPAGNVYVATPRGVYGYNSVNERFFPILGGEGSKISAESVEKYGDELWVSTACGLMILKPDGQTHTYTVDDGLSDNQFVPGASLQASDGKIYYGTVHGFCRVDPLVIRSKTKTPIIKFTGLDIVNTPVEVGEKHLPQSLNNLERLVLTHADHTFSVYFSALSYANPAGNSYLYRLEGFDKTWLESGKENRATYSNLPPGTYTLRVKAANNDGVWNEEGVALKIVVEPAWYASALMKALYVLLGAFLLLVAVRFVVKRIERNHIIELDRISSNKEKEMFRSKLSFFTIVAHEIRTPVSLIIGPLEKILDSSEKFNDAVKEDLHIIDRNARRLLSLVNQLLDFKKVEDNALPMGFHNEKVIPLIENVVDRFRPSVEHKGGKLTTDFPDPDLTADIDPEAITKLVSNLLNNARKFTRDTIHVECRAMPDGKRFIISVADNGIGIGKENRDKIFKPFFQVLDNINESKGGTGLGLSIVKSVADAHGGVIELESASGKGSRFTAILPLHQKIVMPPPELPKDPEDVVDGPIVADAAEDGIKRPVLLVVDDNEEMLGFITSNFEKSYEVITASNGREALDKMKNAQVGLIICDWMMPVMDGVDFLKAVRSNENYSHIPFVMLTAKTDNMSKIETMRSGADAYVEKPFSLNYLEARIENLLEMRALLRQKFSNSPLEPLTTLAPTQVDNELLTKLQQLIEDNISNNELSVDFLADKLGISRSGLYTKIKSLADVTPHELIQLTRLKKAAEYLASGTYRNISEVSYMVGFNNSSYFSRCFSKQFGMKPGEFAASRH